MPPLILKQNLLNYIEDWKQLMVSERGAEASSENACNLEWPRIIPEDFCRPADPSQVSAADPLARVSKMAA